MYESASVTSSLAPYVFPFIIEYVLMATVNGRIKRELEREIAMTDMFQHPTIRAVAKFLAGEKDERAEAEFAQSEARGARRRERLKKRRRKS